MTNTLKFILIGVFLVLIFALVVVSVSYKKYINDMERATRENIELIEQLRKEKNNSDRKLSENQKQIDSIIDKINNPEDTDISLEEALDKLKKIGNK